MIAGIESCIWCHRSEELPTPLALTDAVTAQRIDGQPTWASDQCTLCHRYHTPPGSLDERDGQFDGFDLGAATPATLAPPPTTEASR